MSKAEEKANDMTTCEHDNEDYYGHCTLCGDELPDDALGDDDIGLEPCPDCGETGRCAPSCNQLTDSDSAHTPGCICADCSDADLTATND